MDICIDKLLVFFSKTKKKQYCLTWENLRNAKNKNSCLNLNFSIERYIPISTKKVDLYRDIKSPDL